MAVMSNRLRRVGLPVLQGAIAVALAAAALTMSGSTLGGAQGPPAAGAPPVDWAQRSRTFEQTGLAEPFKGITTDGAVVPDLFATRSTGVSTAPVAAAAKTFLAALSEPQRTKTLFPVDDPEWRKWMNQHFYVRQGVGFNEMSEAQRDAAFGLLQGVAERQGPDADARHHAPQPHARRAERQRLRGVRRVAVLDHRDGHAVGDRALGLAARRPPRDRQLLRAGRSGRDDADVHRLGAGDGDVRQVRRDVGPAGRAEPRPGVHEQRSTPRRRPRPPSRAAKTGNNNLHRGVQGQRACSTTQGVKASELPPAHAGRARRPDRPLRRQHGRRPRQGEDGRGEGAPRRHLLRVDRRDRRRTRSSTTASTAR